MAAVFAAGILNVRPPAAQTPFWSRHIEAHRAPSPTLSTFSIRSVTRSM
jgi:hypothetical protein